VNVEKRKKLHTNSVQTYYFQDLDVKKGKNYICCHHSGCRKREKVNSRCIKKIKKYIPALKFTTRNIDNLLLLHPWSKDGAGVERKRILSIGRARRHAGPSDAQ
jgi:hypothetical protein